MVAVVIIKKQNNALYSAAEVVVAVVIIKQQKNNALYSAAEVFVIIVVINKQQLYIFLPLWTSLICVQSLRYVVH